VTSVGSGVCVCIPDAGRLVAAVLGQGFLHTRREPLAAGRRGRSVLVLMAVCDGELAEKEREFLTNIAGRLEVPLDLGEVEKRTRDYPVAVKQSMSGRAAGTVRATATTTGRRAKGALGKVLKRTTVSYPNYETEES
jgi:hypothetical protein